MKTKRIWMWALFFGISTTLIVYIAMFSNLSATPTASVKAEEQKQVEKKKSEEETKKPEETIVERKISNPMEKVSPGKRAISLKVALEQGVSGYIKPGSYVDLIAYETMKDEKTKKEYKSAVLVLQNIKVLTSGKASDNGEEALNYETVTVEVSPREGVMLGLASKDKDGFYFMLRNSDDKGIETEQLKQTREVFKEEDN